MRKLGNGDNDGEMKVGEEDVAPSGSEPLRSWF